MSRLLTRRQRRAVSQLVLKHRENVGSSLDVPGTYEQSMVKVAKNLRRTMWRWDRSGRGW